MKESLHQSFGFLNETRHTGSAIVSIRLEAKFSVTAGIEALLVRCNALIVLYEQHVIFGSEI